MKLDGAAAVVTGASRGIGRAAAFALAAADAVSPRLGDWIVRLRLAGRPEPR